MYSPHKYFDMVLFSYINEKKSLLFSEEMAARAKERNANEFFEWLDSLNFMPLYNPQTFLLDARKRIDEAKEKMALSHYVVMDEGLEILEQKVGISVENRFGDKKEAYPVTIADADIQWQKQFIGKDLQLYAYARELWSKIESNNYKPLEEVIARKPMYMPLKAVKTLHGGCGGMGIKMIRGYVFDKEKQEPLKLEIYKNGELLVTTLANKPRPDVQEKFNLKTDRHGILVKFDKPTIKPGDKIEVVIVPDNVLIPIVGSAKSFLEGE